MLAERLGFDFFDLDEEIIRRMEMSLEEFVNTENFKTRIIADDILLIELYDTPENIFPGSYSVMKMTIFIQMISIQRFNDLYEKDCKIS